MSHFRTSTSDLLLDTGRTPADSSVLGRVSSLNQARGRTAPATSGNVSTILGYPQVQSAASGTNTVHHRLNGIQPNISAFEVRLNGSSSGVFRESLSEIPSGGKASLGISNKLFYLLFAVREARRELYVQSWRLVLEQEQRLEFSSPVFKFL